MKNSPKTKKDKNSSNHQQKFQISSQPFSISSPIPLPETLEHYDRILPGSAERIFSLVEKQSAHRQALELKVIESDIFNSKCGLLCGFIIGIATVLSGAYCILQGHDFGGAFIGGAGLTGLVSVFVYGSKTRAKERENQK
ncbi:hypothetical protein MTBBW1_50047 [Desulfamplus magnetovallimortis]|uniref:DUF2335 domain-containing protein n=1 Tax=Desulfamplus magnetovallimortis TaxID=1246637 RepID=A0A1W1HHG3_9BACT|nr:DUF2335 domain-containing protein [Desulfamplus magnetovallimortis]SLM31924.1 hypothetical protein MTBBW1_50047 [Desulfamplus magnetovallimortis]